VAISDPRRGVVLVSVLWTIALLSALAMAAGVTFRAFAGVLSVERSRLQGAALETAGLEVAAGILAQLGEEPMVEISHTVAFATGAVDLRITDEGGRIDLNKAPEDVLAGLFRAIGAPQVQAADAARAIVARRSRDGAGGGGTEKPRTGANERDDDRPFSDVRQLARLPGISDWPTPWLDALAGVTTVFGNETVNPLTAPGDVVAALPEMDGGRLAAFLEARRASPTDERRIIASLGPAQRYAKVAKRKASRVLIRATTGDGYAVAAQAVIVLLPQDIQPYRVLAWNPVAVAASWRSLDNHLVDR
jgi:general secretion pathway protein K